MAKLATKRFQSGREIMETYIPDYVSPLHDSVDLPSKEDERKSGAELASLLLKNFEVRLDSLSLKRKNVGASSKRQ